MRRLLLFLLLLCPSLAFAQGGILSGGILVISSSGRPIGGATVTVCNVSDIGVPCTQTVSIYQDPGLTIPAANPGVTDGNGNFIAFAAAGSYAYTVTGSGISTAGQPFKTTVGVLPGGCISSLNGISYIGGACASAWGGGDIGAQANAAYAALPSGGGSIKVLPSLTGNPYQFSTPIVFATSGKYVLFEGIGVGAAQNLTSVTGTVLQFTPTSGDAITLDYVPTGATGWNGRHGINNLTLLANTQVLYGGTIATPNTATSRGVVLGNTNWGAMGASFTGLDIRGFSTNFFVSNQLSWGLKFDSFTSMFSKHGVHLQDIEQVTITNPKFIYNLVALEVSSEVTLVGGSLDQNGGETGGGNQTSSTSAAVVDIVGESFSPDVAFVGSHFEQGQSGALNPMKLVNFASGKVTFVAGSGLDDLSSGSSQQWILAPIINIDGGFNAFSVGRAGTVSTTTTTGYASIYNAAPSHITTTAGIANTDVSIAISGGFPTKSFYGNVNSASGFQIAGGPVIANYATGTWTPVATSLGQTGTPTITGTYTQIGKLVTWTIQIVPGTNTSSTAGTTKFSLPPPGVPLGNAAFVWSDELTTTGSGILGTNGIFPSSWTNLTNPVVLSGSYTAP